ncbi:MAG: hypothetical protein HY540_00275 [Deltaproteobacteria bacterium]|nr:hypothetical protein [Deltaproteobacteria bacterium]
MKKKSEKLESLPEWERLLSAQEVFQASFPESVLVGGTAASLHVHHRISLDADYVLTDLKKRFADVLKQVEEESGWSTKRIEPPVLILGHFQGVRTGIRQLIRKAPLETTVIHGLRVPTIEEMLRIKAYLIVRRNATRDFVDFIAMFEALGSKHALEALKPLDHLYPQEGDNNTVSQQLVTQLAEPKPWDLSETDLQHYKALKEPYTDWSEVKRRLSVAAQKVLLDRNSK